LIISWIARKTSQNCPRIRTKYWLEKSNDSRRLRRL